jgi:hypothetical protein
MKQHIYRVVNSQEFFFPDKPIYYKRAIFDNGGKKFILWTTTKGVILDPDSQEELEDIYLKQFYPITI